MALLLLIAFLAVPLVELWVIGEVAGLIGLGWTLLVLLADSLAGAWLVRREGTRAWRAFREALAGGQIPTREMVDGALILVGGALLLTPGFVTDVVGLAAVAPPTRAALNAGLRRRIGSGAGRATGSTFTVFTSGRPDQPDDPVDIDVVDVHRDRGDGPDALPR